MPLVLPKMMDQEDIEKFIILTAASIPSAGEKLKIDRQDYEQKVRSLADGPMTNVYIDDGDIVSKLNAAAATVP